MANGGRPRPARARGPARNWRGLRRACLASALVALTGWASAERLPLTPISTKDGLASDRILCIVPDSRGFLWFCHNGRLSRFDGERFVRYGPEHGLPSGPIRDLLETSRGDYLVGTAAGVYRFDPHGVERLFAPLAAPGEQAPSVVALLEDRQARLWAGTTTGLYEVLAAPGAASPRHRRVDLPGDANLPTSGTYEIVQERDGDLWLATEHGVVRRTPSGEMALFSTRDGLPGDDVRVIARDASDALWAGTTLGIARLDPGAVERGGALVTDVIRPGAELPHRFVSALFASSDGTLWAGALALGALRPERHTPLHIRWYTTAHGLAQNDVTCFAEDRDGNLWIGTEAGGATRLTRGGFVAFGEAEGLVHSRIASLFETNDGRVCASTEFTISCFDGERFASVPLPVAPEDCGWGWYQWVQQDRAGDWWIPTRSGPRRYTGVRGPQDLARARFTTLCDDPRTPEACNVFRIYEDSRGDLWIGTISTAPRSQLTRWHRGSGRLQRYPLGNGLTIQAPTAFREDGRGSLWIGLFDGGVARLRDGRFEPFGERDGFPPGLVRALHLDAAGRLWAGTERGGLVRIDDPGARRPAFGVLTAAGGLSSDLVASLVEDGHGHLYVGTDRGLDRLDPRSGRIVHFGAADGLPNTYINAALRDRSGRLWFGTLNGVARLDREYEPNAVAPPVFIERVRLAGRPYPISQLGEAELTSIRLAPGDNRVQIEFGGISYSAGGALRYQHRLEGIDRDWTEPDPARSVDYANLAAGRYRFAVRAVTADGRTSPREADVHFEVLRPFWARWWFIALALGTVGTFATAVHRTRVARAVELERVRTRIASDLHDDIGASLSKIAILSDIAQQGAGPAGTTRDTLVRIADTSREMIDAMGDIVWAINPKRDHLADVVQRIRRFASDALSARDIAFTFDAPTDGTTLALGADLRRQAYLVLKESVNNAVRHSGCTKVVVSLRIAGGRLQLAVRDDGRGFDTSMAGDGNGLASMKRRAEELGGTLVLDSRPGRGTTVLLEVPLPRRSYLSR